MKTLKIGLFASVLGLTLASSALALPSIQDVYSATSSGNLQLASNEINQVLAAYPNSAKAHYVDARVLALQGRWSQAAAELATAQRLQPGLPFEHADTLRGFAQQVAAHTGQAPAPRGFPWMGVFGLVLALIAVIALVRLLRTPRQAPVQVITPQGWQGGVPPQPGYGPGYGPGVYPQGPGGGGFMGAVGTGLGLGAGMAAGEMLVDSMFGHHGGQSGGGIIPDANAGTPLPDDQNFGIDDSSSWGDGGGGDWGGGGSDSWN